MTLTLIKKYNKKYKKTYIFLIIVAIIIIIIIVYLFSKKNENFGVDMFSYDKNKWNRLEPSYNLSVAMNQIYRFGDPFTNIFNEKLIPIAGTSITQSTTYFPLPTSLIPQSNFLFLYNQTPLNYNPKYWKSIGVEGGIVTNSAGLLMNSTIVRYGIIKTSSSIYCDSIIQDINHTINTVRYGSNIIPTNPNNNLYAYRPPPSGTLSSPLAVKSILINNKFATDFIIGDVNHGRYLQISQLAVYAMVNGVETNVALTTNGGVASASSNPPNMLPSYAIDGNLKAKNYNTENAFHSNGGGNNEWWYLELDKIYNVHKIVYYNRDGANIRAKGSQIYLFSTPQSDKVNPSNPIYTYTFDETLVQEIKTFIPTPYSYIGCYKDGPNGTDTVSRALPNLLGSGPSINIDSCYNLARNYSAFGLQKGPAGANLCWAGNYNDGKKFDGKNIVYDTSTSFKTLGRESVNSKCADTFGSDGTNQVYRINREETTITNTTAFYTEVNVKHNWQVPPNVTQARFTVIGGSGYGNGHSLNKNTGGNGARISALVTVTPGDIYSIYIGGNANGFYGGKSANGYSGSNGTGRSGNYKGGGGGAATCVFNYQTPIIIAGGGGGCSNQAPDITRSNNIGGSAGMNAQGDGGEGDAPSGTTKPLGGRGGLTLRNNSTSGEQKNANVYAGGAGGGSNGGKMGGEYTCGGAGGSYVNPNSSPDNSIVTNAIGITSVFIDWSNLQYLYKGCYNDRSQRALPVLLTQEKNVESVQECYDLAKYNYDVFGLQDNGMCWAGQLSTDNYQKYGYAANCSNLGNRLTNQVYEVYKAPTTTTANVFATSPNYNYKGCYKDNMGTPALPQYYDRPAKSVDECYNMMKDDYDYNIFALQFGGECWAGNKSKDSYQKYGKINSNCSNVLGGVSQNQVYEIIRQPTTTRAPTTTKAPRTTRPPKTTIPLNTMNANENIPEIAINLVNSQQILNKIKNL